MAGMLAAALLGGCRGSAATSRMTSTPPSAVTTEVRAPVTVRRLVPPPVRDRLEHGRWTVTARGTVAWFEDGGIVHRVDAGGSTPLVGLTIHAGAVHAVDRDGRVVRFDDGNPPIPRVIEPAAPPATDAVADAATPMPVLASLGGDLLLAHGSRIVRRTADGTVIRRELGDSADAAVSGFVLLGSESLLTAGRRVLRVADGRFAGSASRLRAAPASADWPGPLLYARNPVAGEAGGGEVGAMDERVREIDRERWRLPLGAPVRATAFDGGRPIVVAGDAVLVLGRAADRLAVLAAMPLTPGSRLLSLGPDRAGILRPDGRVDPLPGAAGSPAASPSSSPRTAPGIVDPVAAAFDGRVLRVWTADGVVDVDLEGRARAIDPAIAGPPRDGARITASIATRRGRLTPAEAPPGTEGFAAVDGLAWAAASGRLRLMDPGGGGVLADIPIAGVPRWIAPLPGGGGSLVLTTCGEVLRAQVRPRRGGD